MADVQIRRVRTTDAEGMARLMGDPDTLGNMLQLPYPSVEAWRTRLTDWDAPGRTDLLLVAEADGRLIGNAGLNPVGNALRRRHAMALGIMVEKAWHGRGVGNRLMAALLDAADRWLGCLRIELTVYTDNAAAIALYREFGFDVERTHRAFALRDGRYVDALAMARLHPDPPRIDA